MFTVLWDKGLDKGLDTEIDHMWLENHDLGGLIINITQLISANKKGAFGGILWFQAVEQDTG